jgi:hypothetical protein
MTHARVPAARHLAALALPAFVAACVSCAPPQVPVPPAAELTLSLRPKGSCLLSAGPAAYKTDCLAAVQLEIERTAGSVREVDRVCAPIDDDTSIDDLGDLLTRSDLLNFLLWTHQGTAVFRLRGVHATALADGEDPCDPTISPANWLLWGESLPVDLATLSSPDAGRLFVDIAVDCRDCLGGCDDLGGASCPTRLPTSYCVPFTSGFSCQRRCDSAEECFESATVCNADTGRCAPSQGDPAGETGGFCFPCASRSDCDPDFFCVAAPGQQTGLCTELCPLNRCRRGATCRRLGANLILLQGAQTDAGP